MRRWNLYKPLAVLMVLALLPDLSWNLSSGTGPFQAAAQIDVCGGSGNTSTTLIVNTCRWVAKGGTAADLTKFQDDAIAAYLTAHEMPAEDASVIPTYSRTTLRSEIRGLMFARLLSIIKKGDSSRDDFEKRIYAGFQKALQPTEIQYLTATVNEWNRWRNDPCTFTLDAEIAAANNLTYDGNPYCFGGSLAGLLDPPPLPGSHYFKAFGLKNSYSALIKDNPGVAAATANSLKMFIAFGVAAGAALGITGILTAASVYVATQIALITAAEISTEGFTFLGISQIGSASFLAVAGPAAIISLAIIIGVLHGFDVFSNQDQINELAALAVSLSSWQIAPQDLTPLLGDANGMFRLNAIWTYLTTPEVEATTALPLHRPGIDPVFSVFPDNPGQVHEDLTYKGATGFNWTISTWKNWFIQRRTSSDGVVHEAITPTISFIHPSTGAGYIASRKGLNFLVAKGSPAASDVPCPANPATGLTPPMDVSNCSSYVASTIQMKDANGVFMSVSLAFAPVFTSPSSVTFAPGVNKTFQITASGSTPMSITQVSGKLPDVVVFTPGNPATLSGTAEAAAVGSYPITVMALNAGASVTQNLTIYVGTLNLAFTSANTTTLTVGQPASFTITTSGTPTPTLSLGYVPPGMNFKDNGDGTATVSGTPNTIVSPGDLLSCPLSGCGVTASNPFGSVYQDLKIYVAPVPLTIQSNIANLPFAVTTSDVPGCRSVGSYTTSKILSLLPNLSPGGPPESCAVKFEPFISGGTGVRYFFKYWGDQSNSVNPRYFTMPATATTYTAQFGKQNFLTTTAGTGGTISPDSAWFDACLGDCTVSVKATASPGYAFTGFTGDLAGVTNPQLVSTDAPRSVKANFGLVTATAVSASSGQYSDSVTLSATVSAATVALNSGVVGSLQFSVNGAAAGSPVQVNGAGTYTLPYTIGQAQGPYTVGAVFTPVAGVIGSNSTNTLTVSREDATLTPSADNPAAVQVSAPGGTASFNLTTTIQEAAGGLLGDIAKASPVTVTLTPLVAASTVTCPVTTSVASGKLTAVAACTGVPANVYTVTASVGGNYYTGSADSMVTVFDPSVGGVAGAGTILVNGVVNTFQINVKYNKSGQAQGSVVFFGHGSSGNVTVKSSSLQSMAISGNTAVVLGKATVDGVGNYTFQATATGNAKSIANDLFGLQVTDPSGKVVANLSFSPASLRSGTVMIQK